MSKTTVKVQMDKGETAEQIANELGINLVTINPIKRGVPLLTSIIKLIAEVK